MKGEVKADDVRTNQKELRDAIEKQLSQALADWKDDLGDKRFKKRIKQAGKLFRKKLKHTPTKATVKVKKASVEKKKKEA